MVMSRLRLTSRVIWHCLCSADLSKRFSQFIVSIFIFSQFLVDSLDRVLFAAELELSKIPVPRLPQNASNVNIECAGKSKQLYSLCD